MEELADSIGKLSMNAKEWRPQQPDAPTLQQQYQTSRTSSLPALPARLPSSSSFNAPRSPLPPHHQQQQMDQRHYSVGGMWQQPQQQQQQQPLAQSPPTQSDLTAVSVNEFVPGRGWSSGSTSSAGIPQSQYSSNSNSLDVPSSWRGASSSSLKPSSGGEYVAIEFENAKTKCTNVRHFLKSQTPSSAFFLNHMPLFAVSFLTTSFGCFMNMRKLRFDDKTIVWPRTTTTTAILSLQATTCLYSTITTTRQY
jgi:hypothetical protein